TIRCTSRARPAQYRLPADVIARLVPQSGAPLSGIRPSRPRVSSTIGRMPTIGFALAQLSVYVAIAIALQYGSGTHLDDFSAYNDEPSHYVTALMVRDYFAAGLPRGPMQFAENFYIHYPKMAMGHWPPAAYSLFAIWMLVFGAGRTSALLLMAVMTGV